MQYRREIDGLRSLAVVPVVLFHAGFPLFKGGFVGVDVFFVISGYLITSILLAEAQRGELSLIRFYERRARRILPALFVVILACLPFAWLWLVPQDMKTFARTIFAVSLFASNVFFYRHSDYFAPDADLNPLLHTWSLAVEEQYYVLFPLFLIIAWRLGTRWIVSMLVAAALVSLLVAQWGAHAAPIATFFLLPTRGWELLIGALVAFHFAYADERGSNATLRQAGSALGLGLLAYSVCVFDRHTPFPSFHALVPTLGTALIILFATPNTWVGRLLAARPLVGIGLISYSAYLWHQPILAFAKYRSPDAGAGVLAGLTLASFVLAYFSWKHVELPFRNRAGFNRAQVFRFAAAGSAALVALSLAGRIDDGLAFRLTPGEREIAAYATYPHLQLYRVGTCLLEPQHGPEAFSSTCSEAHGGQVQLLVWGDSHAAALGAGLRTREPDVLQLTAASCPPLQDLDVPGFPHCRAVNEYVLGQIARLAPARVVLHANWIMHRQQDLPRHLQQTIATIERLSPRTRVTVVGSVPQWRPTLPLYVLMKRVPLDTQQYLSSPLYAELLAIDEGLVRAATGRAVQFLSALSALCEGGKCLAVAAADGKPALTSWDYGHLTQAGSALLAVRVLEPEPAVSGRN